MTNSEMKALSEIGEAAVNADEALVDSLREPLRLLREAALCLHSTTRAGEVANVGKALWRLLDATGQLAEICPREIYDPTRPTGLGFSLRIHGTIGSEILDEVEAEGERGADCGDHDTGQ